MASFDAEAIFSSIPVELAKQIIMEKWDELKLHAPMTKRKFKEVLEFCLSSGYYKFEDVFYEQKNGLAIGRSLSSIIVELVLDHFFGKLEERPNNRELKFEVKFIDDSLFILHRNKFDDVYKFLNYFHPRLRFTFEKCLTSMIS